MPTDEEIFAGPNRELRTDNLIQVAKTNRNVDIVRRFNALHPNRSDRIHRSTIAARISRGLDAIADRDGLDRAQLKAEFETERARNGVAGRNQHTIATKTTAAAEETEAVDDEEMEDTEASLRSPIQTKTPTKKAKTNSSDFDPSPIPERKTRAKRATRQDTSVSGAERRDSVAGSSVDSSPLVKKSKPAASSSSPQTGSTGKKRKRAEKREADEAGAQNDSGLRKKAKATADADGAASASQRSIKAASGHNGASQGRKSSAAACKGFHPSGYPSGSQQGRRESSVAAKPQVPKTDSSEIESSGMIEGFKRLNRWLDESEADAVFSGDANIDDDTVLKLASTNTIPEIVYTANRAARRTRHDEGRVRRRISLALGNLAIRKGRRRSRVEMELNKNRALNDIQAGGMDKRR